MSQENVEWMRVAWEAFSRGDLPEALEWLTPDVEFDVSHDVWGALVGGGLYRGVEGIQDWLRDLYGAWETFQMEAEDVIDVGPDRVVCVLAARGRGRASGLEVEHHPAAVCTLRDRKVARIVWYPTREEALKAAEAG